MTVEDKLHQTCIWKRSSYPWPSLTSSIDHLPTRALQKSRTDRHRTHRLLRGLPELRRDGRKTSSGSSSNLHDARSNWYVPSRSDTDQEPSRAQSATCWNEPYVLWSYQGTRAARDHDAKSLPICTLVWSPFLSGTDFLLLISLQLRFTRTTHIR